MHASVSMENSEIRKPLIDVRDYSCITLPNGLVALLVSDPSSLVAAVAMSVSCGQMDDPPQVQGLAHFTEHMLFLGSNRPGCAGESYFIDFLGTANGSHNAYTSLNTTTFHYSLSHSHIERSLEIFSGFFACPLLTQDCALREMRAVDSENSKNIQSDSHRDYQLMRSTGKPGACVAAARRFPIQIHLRFPVAAVRNREFQDASRLANCSRGGAALPIIFPAIQFFAC
jgi:insulysin